MTPTQAWHAPVVDFEIEYVSSSFPSASGIRSGHLPATWADLLWAAITIGRPNIAHVFQHHEASLYEAIFRLSLVRMALEQDWYPRRLHQTAAFAALDPTEKGSVSYFLGMAVCKLFADRLLRTPWLLHLDLFRTQLNAQLLGGRSRPDLIGQDNAGIWHAFETKGRSSAPTADDKQKAKAQAQRLVSVDGNPCCLHIGSFAYFQSSELKFYWRDPEPDDPEKLTPLQLAVADESWGYYYQFAQALSTGDDAEMAPGTSLDRRGRGIDAKVYIHGSIRELLSQNRWADARRRARESEESLREQGYQRDGIKVIPGPSWSEREYR